LAVARVWLSFSANLGKVLDMVSLPPGFDVDSLVSDFGALGAYIIGAYVLILGAQFLFKALGTSR